MVEPIGASWVKIDSLWVTAQLLLWSFRQACDYVVFVIAKKLQTPVHNVFVIK